ncbi:MAG: phenylalanine--tRNA ligase subunit beta [Rhodocyclaceae bacterium]|jgi:phenylalanyl-tRNA synthetase beta chain|nr:Phenylalanine--tRNA ligase beta subunit [Rhodocyclaceae bacterium]MBZ0145720.1 phenylalanine--tRNA ligase subunit beta [Rhodocyclaceae bacterium]MCL4682766.1 phenylalanine--tRNA ligase subunit beta [Rhodocyclaceae bacterium]
MQFSEHWLREFVNPPLTSAELAHSLTMAGLEVEALQPVAPAFAGVVVAQVLSVDKHPDADKLKLCCVDAGQGDTLQIVCGAPNVSAGMKVPCALVGAELPGLKIKAAKVRGVESFGMLCSARELGLSEDHSGLLALPPEAPVGEDIRTCLALDDKLFTLKLTPNRADCLSLKGVAREVGALTGTAASFPPVGEVRVTSDKRREVVLDAPAACPRYCGRVISGIDAKAPTPDWMKRRLERSGLRSISAVVDITNYVMLELGQPLHAFDNVRLDGAVHVRYPAAGEKLLLLNGQTVEPSVDTALIADDSRALAMAGIMGGEESGIADDTTELFLESAFFAPDAIAGKARALGFSSDASYRFERGVDFAAAREALERASRLIMDICGGQAGPVAEAVDHSYLPMRAPVRLRVPRAEKILGIRLGAEVAARLFKGLDFHFTQDEDVFTVTPPSHRFDIAIEEDLVEELARLHGYDNIPARHAQGSLAILPQNEQTRSVWRLRRLLAARDYQEVVNYSFVDAAWERDFCANDDPVVLANPIASQMGVMRSSLIGGLVANLVGNLNRRQDRVRVFETGRCFLRDATGDQITGFLQPKRVAALAWGPAAPEQWGVATRRADFFDAKADVEALLAPLRGGFERLQHPALHPGRAASVILQGKVIGLVGELHPHWVQKYELGSAPVLFELDLDAVLQQPLPAYQEVSRFPGVVRDIALVVAQEQSAQPMLETLLAVAPAFVREVVLFDVYHGKGVDPEKKSLAFRVVMQDTEKTLSEGEVDAAVMAMIEAATKKFAAKLRS